MSEQTQTYSEEEAKEYAEAMVRQYAQERSNLHGFLTKVIENDDTTKVGNVSAEELGNPKVTLRALKELELFCRAVYKDKSWADYFKDLSEIQTSTSLSKEGFLMELSVSQKQELSKRLSAKQTKENKGWFKRGSKK